MQIIKVKLQILLENNINNTYDSVSKSSLSKKKMLLYPTACDRFLNLSSFLATILLTPI